MVITYWIQISYVYFFVNRNFVKSMFNENQGLFLVLKNQTLLHSLLAMRVEQNFKEIVNKPPHTPKVGMLTSNGNGINAHSVNDAFAKVNRWWFSEASSNGVL